MRPTNSVDCKPFTEAAFCREVWGRSSGRPTPPPFKPRQVEYIAAHLRRLGAVSLLIEAHYIDRHYVEEVGLYYSRCLGFSGNACTRIHAFRRLGDRSALHDDGRLDRLLQGTPRSGPAAATALLDAAYLGYVVVRPQPSVPIGRSVLRPPPAGNSRWIQAQYGAHVMGLSLRVDGLAFQQQDRAVGACATTAVWTALQQTCKKEADRPPTPSAITQAAVRNSAVVGRVLPSAGLTIAQICDAFRFFEFPPDVFDVDQEGPELFLLRLNTYVRSGIPAVLAIEGPGRGHAVAVAGFSVGGRPTKYTDGGRSIETPNLDFTTVYVHDDRIGPYVKAGIRQRTRRGKRELTLTLHDHKRVVETPVVTLAVVPLYPKLRTTAYELLEASFYLLPAFEARFAQGRRLSLELFFKRSGDYMTELYSLPVDPQRLAAFQRSIALSRYVGISRWRVGDELILDAIWDTTDTLREETIVDQFWLGIVGFRASDYALIDQIAARSGLVAG